MNVIPTRKPSTAEIPSAGKKWAMMSSAQTNSTPTPLGPKNALSHDLTDDPPESEACPVGHLFFRRDQLGGADWLLPCLRVVGNTGLLVLIHEVGLFGLCYRHAQAVIYPLSS